MDDNRKKLLALLEKLNLPLAPEEAHQLVAKLSDEEVNNLLFVYRAIERQQNLIDKNLRQVDPQGYDKIEEEQKQALAEIEREYFSEMKEVQKKADSQLDDLDKQETAQITKMTEELDLEVEKNKKIQQEFLDKLNSAVS